MLVVIERLPGSDGSAVHEHKYECTKCGFQDGLDYSGEPPKSTDYPHETPASWAVSSPQWCPKPNVTLVKPS